MPTIATGTCAPSAYPIARPLSVIALFAKSGTSSVRYTLPPFDNFVLIADART